MRGTMVLAVTAKAFAELMRTWTELPRETCVSCSAMR